MIGLGLVCYSISSKVILLAAIWRNTFKLANRIPLIPVFTALACLFLSAFLFEMASLHNAYFVPARVLAGLGGICFTLFSIVSILESGTSKQTFSRHWPEHRGTIPHARHGGPHKLPDRYPRNQEYRGPHPPYSCR